MKKQFTTFLMSAAMMLVATAFTACSSEVEIDDNNGGGKSTAQTIFSSTDDDATRTSIDNKALFYWEKGDKIWIDTGTGFEPSSQSDITTAKQARAKFVVDGNFIGNSYKVLYTGYTNNDTTTTSYSTVTIAHQQTQKVWNDGSHLGTSGDCGTATAHKKPGGYQFSLEHKASYLIIYPYIDPSLSDSYTLEKIDIYADNDVIAGRYNFNFNTGLAATPINGTGKSQITLNCGTSGFQLSNDVPDVTSTTNIPRHLFVVLAPGMHQLTLKYTVKNTTTNTEVVFWKDLSDTNYEPNGVYPYIHVLKDQGINVGTYYEANTKYQWGTTVQPYAQSPNIYSKSLEEYTEDFWGTTVPSWEEIVVYTRNRPYWDNSTEWDYVRYNGTTEHRRGGAWIKKAAYTVAPYTGSSMNVPIIGRPAENVRNQYFFLPAFQAINGVNGYWTRTPTSSDKAYSFIISKSSVGVSADYQKHNPWIANVRTDGTGENWFQ